MKRAFMMLLTSSIWGCATSAYAQGTTDAAPAAQQSAEPDTAPAAASNAKSDGEIVVTAQRREQRLLDVPISISVVSLETAQSSGIVSTRELSLVTPALVGGQAGYAFQPTVRGVSSTGTSPGEESNVALYVDDVYIAAVGATAFNLANIERIEVLKGPQGTLFGRNATGGAIRIVTSAPSFEPEARVNASLGVSGPNSREISVYGSTGLSKTLAFSLAGYGYTDDGYLKNVDPNFSGKRQGALDTYMVRAKALFQPSDDLSITGAFDYGETKSGVELTTAFIDDVNGFKNVEGVLSATGPREVATNEQNFMRTTNYGGYVNISYDVGDFTIRSLSAARKATISVSLDNDRTNLALNRNVYQVETDSKSQELTLTSDLQGPLNFILGLYYFNSGTDVPYFQAYAATIGPVVDGVRQVTAPISLRSHLAGSLDTDAYAAFGEATLELSDQFSVIGGLRYNIDKKHASLTNVSVPTSADVSSRGKWSNLDHRLTLNFKPNDDTLLYVTHSTGFKSGFINALSSPQQIVKPEVLTAIEAGVKTRLFDRLNMSLAAFHYDYKNIQLTVNNALSAANGTVGPNLLQNAARAKIAGIDFDLNGRISQNFNLRTGFAWLPKSKYSEFAGGIAYVANPGGLGATALALDLSGTRVVRSPKFTFNVGLDFNASLGSSGGVYASANYYRNSGMFLAVGESPRQPAYNLLGLEAGWRDPTEKYRIGVFARNLTNEAYFISGLANTGGFSGVWGKPREIGIRLSGEF